jgi:hypothetical protein
LSSDEFWTRVAGMDEADLREVLNRGEPNLHRIVIGPDELTDGGPGTAALKGIMGKPALRQSFKGLLTAGFSKSMVYAGRKVGKWWRAKVRRGLGWRWGPRR